MILGFCGSPRSGATEYVIKEALRMIESKGYETEFYTIKDKEIKYCIHCDYCLQNKGCIFNDDMDLLYELLKEAEGIIIGTPVYNGGITAQTKAVLDRTRAIVATNPKVFEGKKGIAVAIGGDRIGGQELAIQQIITFYLLNGIIPLSGGFFGSNIGATFWSKDTLESVKADEEGFKSLKKTVKRFLDYIDKGREKTE